MNPKFNYATLAVGCFIGLTIISAIAGTNVTRFTTKPALSLSNVALPTVQKMAGHSNIKTTLTYYNNVASDDMRAA